MSEENVEVVRQAVEAINQRDVDGYLACCTRDVQLITPVAPVAGAYDGPDGIRRFFADIADATPDFTLVIERLEAMGRDRVLALIRLTATGRASGIQAGAEAGHVYLETGSVYDLASGKIRRTRVFLDRQEALEAARLRK